MRVAAFEIIGQQLVRLIFPLVLCSPNFHHFLSIMSLNFFKVIDWEKVESEVHSMLDFLFFMVLVYVVGDVFCLHPTISQISKFGFDCLLQI